MKHEFITCDKVGCGKELNIDDEYWQIVCHPQFVRDENIIRTLDFCPACYEDVCLFINNKENEVTDGQQTRTRKRTRG